MKKLLAISFILTSFVATHAYGGDYCEVNIKLQDGPGTAEVDKILFVKKQLLQVPSGGHTTIEVVGRGFIVSRINQPAGKALISAVGPARPSSVPGFPVQRASSGWGGSATVDLEGEQCSKDIPSVDGVIVDHSNALNGEFGRPVAEPGGPIIVDEP